MIRIAQKTIAREGEKLDKFRGFWRSRRRHSAPKSLFPELSVYSGEGTGGFTSAPTPRSRGQEPRMLTMLLRKYERLKFLKECDRVSLPPSYLNGWLLSLLLLSFLFVWCMGEGIGLSEVMPATSVRVYRVTDASPVLPGTPCDWHSSMFTHIPPSIPLHKQHLNKHGTGTHM